MTQMNSHTLQTLRRFALSLSAAVALSVSLSTGTVLAQNAQRGADLSKPCAACHGEDGNSIAPTFPRLAGQHADYLVHSLRAYRSGARKNAIMSGQIGNLTDQDFRDLAAHYARMKGSLQVVRH